MVKVGNRPTKYYQRLNIRNFILKKEVLYLNIMTSLTIVIRKAQKQRRINMIETSDLMSVVKLNVNGITNSSGIIVTEPKPNTV